MIFTLGSMSNERIRILNPILGIIVLCLCTVVGCGSQIEKRRNLRLTFIGLEAYCKSHNGELPKLNGNKEHFARFFGRDDMNWRVILKYVVAIGSHDRRLTDEEMRTSIFQSGKKLFETDGLRIIANLSAVKACEHNANNPTILLAYSLRSKREWYEDESEDFGEQLEAFCSAHPTNSVMTVLSDGRIGVFQACEFSKIRCLLDPVNSRESRIDALRHFNLLE